MVSSVKLRIDRTMRETSKITGHVVLILITCSLISVAIGQQCETSRKGLIPGDITIGFLFPFVGSSEDGFLCDDEGKIPDFQNIQLIEAAIYAIKSDSTTTNGIKIGLEVWDTCSSGQVAVEQTMAYLADRTPTKPLIHQPCDSAAFKPMVIGHLVDEGPAVASLLTDARVPVISYASTIADLTVDQEYDFFSRNIVSDDDIARALVSILKRMGWTYVAMVTTDIMGERSAGETFRQVAESSGICVAVRHTIADDAVVEGDFDAALQPILAKPSVKVVVLFTSSTVAEALYDAAARLSAELQWVAGHRAILDQSSLDQQPMVTRGLLGVIPSTLQSSAADFDTYFQNLTPDGVNSTTDPWFADYWQQSLGCNIGGPLGTTPQCSQQHEQEHRNNYIKNPYAYSIIQAVTLAKHAIQNLQREKCNGTLGVCTGLAVATPRDWQDAVRNLLFLSQDASASFGFRPDGSTADTLLSIVNMKEDGASATGYSLQQVGSWRDGSFTFDPNSLDLWTGSLKQPLQSVCETPCQDEACGPTTDNRTMVYLSGDLIIGGLFSLHSWDAATAGCGDIRREGVLRLEAMLYALDLINQDESILPGIRLGVDGLDTCSNPTQAGEAAQHFITSADFGSSGSGERLTPDGATELVYGVVGPESDRDIVTASRVLSLYGVPLVAYDSSSTVLSSSGNFPNVARVTPVNYADTIPFARALAEKGIRYVQVLHSSAFSSARSVFKSIGRQNGLCVSQELAVSASMTQVQWDDLFAKLASRPEAKAVVLLLDPDLAKAFMTQLQDRNLIGRYYVIGNYQFPVEYFLQNDLNIIKGLIVIQQHERSYQELQSNLTSLRPDTNTRNPWFAEFWMEEFKCRLNGYSSSYSDLCTETETLDTAAVTDDVLARVVDATYVMAKALDAIQRDLCPTGQVCQGMTDLAGSDLFRKVTQQLFYSPLGDGEIIRFNSIGDPVASFYVYNYQAVNGEGLTRVEIASYISYGFTKTDAAIVVYDEQGQEIEDPQLECSGQCDECYAIDEGRTAYINGDIWIGGFFGISEPEADQYTCSGVVNDYNIQLLEAFLYAVDDINSDPSVLPNTRLGAVGFDTCGSAEKARRETSNYVGGTVEYRASYFPTSVSVAGIIGGQTSDTSVAIAEVLNSFRVNQISYGASASELSNNNDYPFFLRTIPSDAQQAKAIADLITYFGWRYVSIVYSDNAYGNDILEEFKYQALKANVCIAMAIRIPTTGPVEYSTIITQLKVNQQSKVVLLFTSDYHTKRILEAAEATGADDLQWVGSDTWGSREYVTANASTVAQGALIVELRDVKVEAFRQYLESHTGYNNNRNPWWQDFIMDTFQCQLSGKPLRFENYCTAGYLDFTGKYTLAAEVINVINAVKAFALGLDTAIKSLCPNLGQYESCDAIHSNPAILHNHIKNVSLVDDDGSAFTFDANGDGQPQYNIISINSSLAYNKVGTWDSGRLQITPSSPTPDLASLRSECSGRCAECSRSSSVQPFSSIHRSGELQIAALLAAHTKSNDFNTECGSLLVDGVLNAEALLYAIGRINSDDSILPGVTIGTSTFDTCQSAGRGVRELAGFLSGAQSTWYLIGGVLAGGSDAEVSSVGIVAEQYKYTQVVYSSVTVGRNTPTSLLSVAATNNHKARAVADILLHFDWTYVGVVYDALDPQQQSLFRAFENIATQLRICLGEVHQLTNDDDQQVKSTIQSLQDTPGLNVVVIFADSALTKSLLESTSASGQKLTFLLAFPQEYPDSDVTNSFVGSLAVFTPLPPTVFQEFLASLDAGTEGSSQWFVNYIEDRYSCDADGDGNYASPCEGSEGIPLSDVVSFGSHAGSVIDSVNVIAYGLHNLLEGLCGDSYSGLCPEFLEAGARPQDIHDALMNVTFTGTDGIPVRFVDGVRVPQFDVWNGQAAGQDASFVKVGSWNLDGLSFVSEDFQLFDSSSRPGHVQSQCSPGDPCQEACSIQVVLPTQPTRPPHATRPPLPRTRRPRPSPTSQILTSEGVSGAQDLSNAIPYSNMSGIQFYIVIVVSCIGAFITLTMVIMIMARWSNPTTRGISSFLHLTLLLGILLLYILVPILSAPVSSIICSLQRIVSGISFAVCYISIFLLVVRLYRIGIRERRITGKRALIFSVFILVEVVFLIQWLVQESPNNFVYVDSREGTSLTTTMYCGYTSGEMAISLLYVYLLMALSIIVSVQAWCSVKVVFTREFGTFIATVSICACVMAGWIISVVVIDRSYTELISSINAIVQASVLLFVLVIPKVKLLCTGHHDEFWESASVTSSEYGGYPRRSADFTGIENYPNEDGAETESVTRESQSHENPAYDNSEPDRSLDLTKL